MGKGRFALTDQQKPGRPPNPIEDRDWKIAQTEMPARPEGLIGDAAEEWHRIERYLVALDRVSSVDRQALSVYCTQWASFARIMKTSLADESTKLYAEGPTCEVPHPLISPLIRYAKAVVKVAGQFGMTARTRDLESDHGNRKASALKRLLGNQRKIAEDKLADSIVPMLPNWTDGDMAPPLWLSARAYEEFERLGSQLTGMDLFTPLDLTPLVVVSCLFDLYMRAGEQMKDPLTYVTRWDKENEEEEVFEKEHPLHKIQSDLHETMQAIWKDYGQTPRYRKVFNGERRTEEREVPMIFKGKFG